MFLVIHRNNYPFVKNAPKAVILIGQQVRKECPNKGRYSEAAILDGSNPSHVGGPVALRSHIRNEGARHTESTTSNAENQLGEYQELELPNVLNLGIDQSSH